jgi:hypothetical protein
MTRDSSPGTFALSSEMADVLSRVRQVDPIAEETAVRGYLREMADASALLDTIELRDEAPQVSFSASWPEGSV